MLGRCGRRGLSLWSRHRAAEKSLREKLGALGMGGAEAGPTHSLTVDDIEASQYSEEAEYPPLKPHHTFLKSRSDPNVVRIGDPKDLLLQRRKEAAYVAALPTAEEKIFAVSPFERDWTRKERKFHRVNNPDLVEPRGAWEVPITAAPAPYGTRAFVQRLTKTLNMGGVPKEELGQTDDARIPAALAEALEEEFRGALEEEATRAAPDFPAVAARFFLSAARRLAPHVERLEEARLTLHAPQESFWVRGGFQGLYPEEEMADNFKRRSLPVLGGDDRRRLGELAFCTRDTALLALTSPRPLAPLPVDSDAFPMKEYMEYDDIPGAVFDPAVLGYALSREPLAQSPCYTAPSASRPTQPCVHATFWDARGLYSGCKMRGLEVDEIDDALLCAAVTAGFSTAVAQAHSLGFTQLNDLTYPILQQVILTDGREWTLAAYQLETLGLQSSWEEDSGSWNRVWVDEVFHLFEDDNAGGVGSWDSEAFTRILRLILPAPAGAVEDLTPFLGHTQPVPLHRNLQETPREQASFS